MGHDCRKNSLSSRATTGSRYCRGDRFGKSPRPCPNRPAFCSGPTRPALTSTPSPPPAWRGRVAVEALSRKDTPTQAQRADTEAMLAWGAPPGLLPQMPKLRWAQALTAGVEGWLALPDLPPALTLTCARGTHRESMAENIFGRAVPPHEALRRHRRGPEAQQVGPPRRDAARRARRWAFSGSAPSVSRWRRSPPRSACA